MNASHVFIASAFALAEGALFFVGCGQSGNGSADSGPACEPACLDALFEAFPDVKAPDSPAIDAGDGAATCPSVCTPLEMFKGCPFPGCTAACIRQETACNAAFEPSVFVDLLDCQAKAHFACEATDAGTIPVAAACAKAAEAVATMCVMGDGAAPEAGSCAMDPTLSECEACCGTFHSEGASTYELVLTHCACTAPGLCLTECVSTACAGMTPPAGSACAKCLEKATAPDGGCATSISAGCGADPDCIAYEQCVMTHCTGKKM